MSENTSEPISLNQVRSRGNEEIAAELEALAAKAREGEFVGLVVFKFAQLPRAVAHEVLGQVVSADAVFAIERWKLFLLAQT